MEGNGPVQHYPGVRLTSYFRQGGREDIHHPAKVQEDTRSRGSDQSEC